ncbi:MAG: GatB/YqeY domain-containing protein [Acidaminobacteraceae bacterium]
MILKDQLMIDLKAAMKAKNVIEKSTITMLRAAIKQIEIDKRVELENQDVIEIIAKQVKQKKGSIEEFAKMDRTDLIEEAQAEIKILSNYLPEPFTSEEVAKLISDAIASTGASSPKEMGKVMGIVNPQVVGRADGKTVSSLVKEMLSNL